jgi:hypothetical protein
MRTLLTAFLLLSTPSAATEGLFDRPECSTHSKEHYYFPKETPTGEGISEGEAAWYSEHLRAMIEPSLSCGSVKVEIYRFLWLRTWGRPIAVRITRWPEETTLDAVELDGFGGYTPGLVNQRVHRKLTAQEWTSLSSELRTLNFWSMPSKIADQGKDGAQWVLEGRAGGKYHVVNRWSPESGQFRSLCLRLVKSAGFAVTGTGKRDGIY